ncbi:hypothetical protein ABTO49_20815, partial [Acinetobacter baumannii]
DIACIAANQGLTIRLARGFELARAQLSVAASTISFGGKPGRRTTMCDKCSENLYQAVAPSRRAMMLVAGSALAAAAFGGSALAKEAKAPP